MWHGGKPERVEVPIANGADQWRSIAKQSASFQQSDKTNYNHPYDCAKFHVLADDLFEYSKVCSIGALTKDALRQLAVRYNPELCAETTVAEVDQAAAVKSASDVPATDAATPAPVESVEQRRARYLAWHIEEHRVKPRGALQRVYEREAKQNPKADRANIGKDIVKARGTAKTQKQANAWTSQLIADGKRQN